ncbi:MAG: response regulator [Deltaproteobacteria bacterium]|nr:response regulator [Deltaproteobacteria bacterium]MBW1870778.1 response regulator [Deltaproteobacteria bacterium]
MSKKILIVDDEADIRKFLTTVLEKEGYQTVTAEDGLKALEIAKQEKPDLVILDLQMPNQTGTDFYRKMSKDKELGKTPVIIVSGLAGRHLAVKEPVAVFDKPIDPEEFVKTVEKALA